MVSPGKKENSPLARISCLNTGHVAACKIRASGIGSTSKRGVKCRRGCRETLDGVWGYHVPYSLLAIETVSSLEGHYEAYTITRAMRRGCSRAVNISSWFVLPV